MFKSKTGLVSLLIITIAIILTLINEFTNVTFAPEVMMGVRWVVALTLIVNAVLRKILLHGLSLV